MCGKCCYTNTYLIRELLKALHQSNKFCFYLIEKFPEIREEVISFREMGEKESLDLVDSFEAEQKENFKEMGAEEFLKTCREECARIFSDQDNLLFSKDNELGVIYRMVLKLSNLGHKYPFNSEGENCVFLKDSDDKKICLIHPDHLKGLGIDVKSDPRGRMCADYFCRKNRQ
jgi:Fe-S-cluster containining protein